MGALIHKLKPWICRITCPMCQSTNGRRLNNGNWQCSNCGAVTAGGGG